MDKTQLWEDLGDLLPIKSEYDKEKIKLAMQTQYSPRCFHV